jgi:hypothetical protein
MSQSKHCRENSTMIATGIPLERKEHTPAFTSFSPDFKYYAASKW